MCVVLPGCNVNHPVQGWVGPKVNEAKTRLSGKSSRRSYQDGRRMKTSNRGGGKRVREK